MTRHLPATLALAAVFAAFAAFPAAARADEERVDKTIPFQAGGTLELHTFSGHVTITGGTGTDVVVHAVRHGSRDRLDHIHLAIDTSGSTIKIDANRRDDDWNDRHDNVVETDFDIQVPSDIELDVTSFSSDVRVKGVARGERIHAFSGDLHVDGARGPLNLQTFSGDIEVSLAPGATGPVDFDSFSGRLRSDVPLTFRSSSRRHIQAQLGNGDGTNLRFKTFSGDVQIH